MSEFFQIPTSFGSLFDDSSIWFYIVVLVVFLIFYVTVRHIFRVAIFRRQCSSLAKLSGDDFEKFLCQLYSMNGYKVRKLGGKGDFGVDILATKDGITTAIQAKRYTKNVSLSAVQEVYAGKTYYGADEAVVITTSRFTRAAKMLAEPCEVALIDGECLEKMVEKSRM